MSARVGLGQARRVLFIPRSLLEQQDRLRKRVEELAAAVKDIRKQQGRQQAALAKWIADVDPVVVESRHRDFEHGTLTAQVGVLESRLAELEARLDAAMGGIGAEEAMSSDHPAADAKDAARALVDEVRREHKQVRVRLQMVAQYEERLRRLEATVADLSGLTEKGARQLI